MYTQFFGNYLLANGYVTRDQLFSAMRQEADQHMKLGTLAIHAGYMNAAQVDDVVIHQTHQDNRFGELAIQLGYLTEAQVEELYGDSVKTADPCLPFSWTGSFG